MNNIQDIESYIKEKYIEWSNEFPLACVDAGNELIQYGQIPPEKILEIIE